MNDSVTTEDIEQKVEEIADLARQKATASAPMLLFGAGVLATIFVVGYVRGRQAGRRRFR